MKNQNKQQRFPRNVSPWMNQQPFNELPPWFQNNNNNWSNGNGNGYRPFHNNNNNGWLPRNLRKKKYCWTHGNCAHDSRKCNSKGTGHKNEATFQNKMGGSEKNCQYCT